MKDIVFIESLEIEALIGVHDWERKLRQRLVFDVELAFDNRKPAATDDLRDALDYAAVCARLQATVDASSYRLIESLAEACCRMLLNEFAAQSVSLRIAKPGAVREARSVGVHIRRERDEHSSHAQAGHEHRGLESEEVVTR